MSLCSSVKLWNTSTAAAVGSACLHVVGEDAVDEHQQYRLRAMKRFKNVYFIDKAGLTGTDHVTSADGTHPSDLGYWRWAQNLQPELLKVLKKHGIR